MSWKALSTTAAAAILLGSIAEGFAGGRPVECYERYQTAPVYDTVYENVLVRPASQYTELVPPIYGTRKRAVLVSAGEVTYETVPAVTRTHYRTVKVEGGYAWEWRVINGRRVLCKIWHKAHYRKVAERVVVQEAYQRRIVGPAYYENVVDQVVIQPEWRRVVHVPAGYQTVARQVLARKGESGWKRINVPRHCTR